jgi:photosystem II stability/assembly factor-like uncharacterized protein
VGGLPINKTVNGLAVEPSNPKVMYAAMRDGLFKSVDAGETWKRIGNELKNLATVAVNQKKATEVYVSTVEGTVYVSTDSGLKWRKQS